MKIISFWNHENFLNLLKIIWNYRKWIENHRNGFSNHRKRIPNHRKWNPNHKKRNPNHTKWNPNHRKRNQNHRKRNQTHSLDFVSYGFDFISCGLDFTSYGLDSIFNGLDFISYGLDFISGLDFVSYGFDFVLRKSVQKEGEAPDFFWKLFIWLYNLEKNGREAPRKKIIPKTWFKPGAKRPIFCVILAFVRANRQNRARSARKFWAILTKKYNPKTRIRWDFQKI